MAVPVAPTLQKAAPGTHRNAHAPLLATGFPGGVPPIPVGTPLASGVTGVAYSATITAEGGTSPYTFSVSSGALPTGTSLNSSTGAISGTPTVAATFTFTIKVTDAHGATGTFTFQIAIASPSSGATGFAFVG